MADIVDSILSRLITKAFSPRPTVKREGVFLVIESDWRTAMLTLGGRKRRVTVDPQNKIIRIQDRRFWAFTNCQVIAFDRVQEIIYSYNDMLESGWISHNSEDLFRVGLWLHDNRSVILFRFYGQGEFVNNSIWPDWMRWEDILPGQIVRHDMDSEALAVADLLSAMVGVPVGNGPPP